MTNTSEMLHRVGDTVAATVTIGAVMQWVPPLVAVLNAVYIIVRLYDWVEGRIERARLKQEQSK